jgi:hypothetical protein
MSKACCVIGNSPHPMLNQHRQRPAVIEENIRTCKAEWLLEFT